jgi:hypothetical protein
MECLLKFSPKNILEFRKSLNNFSEGDITNFIRSTIKSTQFKNRCFFQLNDSFVCEHAWCAAYGISSYKFNIAMKNTDAIFIHGNIGIIRDIPWTATVSSWLSSFFAAFCDYMPNSSTLYLPIWVSF